MRTIHRNQAEIEAKEVSLRLCNTVTVYKIPDGRYEVERGYKEVRAREALARFNNGWQEF